MLFERRATQLVLDALAWSPVVLVEGPRQTGKSVLVRDLVSEQRPSTYVTLDDALRLAGALEDPQGFVLGLPDPAIIDEVQLAPEIFRPLKLTIDADRRPGRFTLTGSSNVLLLPQLADSLAGRMAIVSLLPLSQGEIDGTPERFVDAMFSETPPGHYEAAETRASLAERIVRGGFPYAVTLPSGAARDGWMSAYTTTLLERDIREIARINERVSLARLLRLLAARSGTILNVSSLSSDTGIARATMDRYLSAFERVFAVRLIPAWSGDIGRRLLKAPKLLFADSGLACHLAGLDAERLAADGDALGSALETFVGGELAKQISWSGVRYELMHYRDGSHNEVDWVIERPDGKLVGIEVKSTATPSAREFRGLRAFASAVGERFARGVVLHTGTSAASMGEDMHALPIETLWRL